MCLITLPESVIPWAAKISLASLAETKAAQAFSLFAKEICWLVAMPWLKRIES